MITKARGLALVAGLAGAVALGGCGERGIWNKQGATASERVSAQKNCVAESGQYDFLNNEGESSVGRYNTGNTSDVYRMCMFSRGFGQMPESEYKKQKQTQPQ